MDILIYFPVAVLHENKANQFLKERNAEKHLKQLKYGQIIYIVSTQTQIIDEVSRLNLRFLVNKTLKLAYGIKNS
jgi:hypothetical protein